MNDSVFPTFQNLNDFSQQIPQLTLWLNSQAILKGKNARLYGSKNRRNQVRLNLCLDWAQYKSLETEKWFGFDPTIRGKMSGREFVANYDVEITLLLDPDLIDVFTELQPDAKNFNLTLKTLGQKRPAHPLLEAENWLLLSAQQKHPHGKSEYRTVWDYLNLTKIASQSDLDEENLEGIVDFIQDSIIAEVTEDGGGDEPSTEIIERLVKILGKWSPDLRSLDRPMSDRLVTDIIELLQEPLCQSLSTQLERGFSDEPTPNSPLLEAIASFFKQENWSFTLMGDRPLLYLKFQGERGQWDCLTLVQEDQKLIIFYSILEEKVPLDKCLRMCELICRINYGLPLGSFELNVEDGEIRCRTSLAAAGISVNSRIIEALVYNNLLLMDRYLAVFQTLIHTDTPLTEILDRIEELK